MAKPNLLNIPTLASIHLKYPNAGKALQEIVRYVNQNVTPPAGNKVTPLKIGQ